VHFINVSSYAELQCTTLSPLKYYLSPVQKLIYIIGIVNGLTWDLPQCRIRIRPPEMIRPSAARKATVF
jgi:hypothetical protein